MEITELMKKYEETTYLDDDPQALIQIIEYLKECIQEYKTKAEAYDLIMRGGKKAIEETCKAFKISDIGEFSDGFHTFNTLYHQRAVLFATLVNTYSSHSWKSYRHEDGQICFGGGWFIVGIDTPKGSYTYHYENKYWDMFNCQTYENAKHWDGHTDDDVERLLTLPDGWEEKS